MTALHRNNALNDVSKLVTLVFKNCFTTHAHSKWLQHSVKIVITYLITCTEENPSVLTRLTNQHQNRMKFPLLSHTIVMTISKFEQNYSHLSY